MKRIFFILSLVVLFIPSCQEDILEPEPVVDTPEPVTGTDSRNLILRIGTDLSFGYDEIELYDSSAHIIYFKTNHPEFEKLVNQPFYVMADADTIYTGSCWPMYFSSHPPGPYIATYPLYYQNYALRIDIRPGKADPRNSAKIIKAFADRGKLGSGLSLKINSIECGASAIRFSYSITNREETELLVLDQGKMGLSLFHYFTNGLIIRKQPGTSYINLKIPDQSPSPWNSWDFKWLTYLAKDETKTFLTDYPVTTPLSAGEYTVSFTFPGLAFQVNRDKVFMYHSRIWLGELTATMRFTVGKD